MSNDLISAIRVRQASTAAKVTKMRAQLESLERELNEYETAIRVFEQMSGTASQALAGPVASRSDTDGPSMPDLILRALEQGPKPIADVTALVSSLSGKPVDPNNIRSTAWRMWKAGRIEKTGDDYHLIGRGPEFDDFEDLLA